MQRILIKGGLVINRGKSQYIDVLTENDKIVKIDPQINIQDKYQEINGDGLWLIPGIIDDQVHFREPGFTHKADIASESKAAIAGGITSFMEMPNTVPPVFTQSLLEDKYQIASRTSLANYSFFMGASNDNLEEVLKTDIKKVCGLKIFMGSSTGNLLVDDPKILEGFFSRFPSLIATHCEDEPTIRKNTAEFKERYGEMMPVTYHPQIRSAESCFKSSSFAISLAKRHGTRLHILHISTARETNLFDNTLPLEKKKITAEACVHHLWFNDSDYEKLGMLIKWNPGIKTSNDQKEILCAVLDDRIDVIATDDAPHTIEEKKNNYFQAPSGGPLIQHSLVAMMEFYHQKKISIEKIVQKMAHNPAILFEIDKRGFLREGYFADLVLVNPNQPWQVTKANVLAKCGWSPFEGSTFQSTVTHTFVSGHLVYAQGKFDESTKGSRWAFSR